MYVRWQTYRSRARDPRHRARNDERARLRAILVESVRVNGEARQKYIAFLGSLTIAQAGSDPDALWFWYRVTKRLDRLGARIGSEDRARISASIAKRVAAADDGR
jgi:hypothetical protein